RSRGRGGGLRARRDEAQVAGGGRRGLRRPVRARPAAGGCGRAGRGGPVAVTNVVGAILFAGVVLYAIFGGADFGAGFWDLTAGGAERGRRPRALIDLSIGPVWEANHVWLIFCFVVAWSAFPVGFAAVMRTLYVPLGLAALGIVLRG